MTVWGDDVGVTWANAPAEIREQMALVRLFWFFRLVETGGPDGSELDDEVVALAREAALWFGPILQERAQQASAPTAQRGAGYADQGGAS